MQSIHHLVAGVAGQLRLSAVAGALAVVDVVLIAITAKKRLAFHF